MYSFKHHSPEPVVFGSSQRRIYYLKWKLLSFAKVKWAFWLALPIRRRVWGFGGGVGFLFIWLFSIYKLARVDSEEYLNSCNENYINFLFYFGKEIFYITFLYVILLFVIKIVGWTENVVRGACWVVAFCWGL